MLRISIGIFQDFQTKFSKDFEQYYPRILEEFNGNSGSTSPKILRGILQQFWKDFYEKFLKEILSENIPIEILKKKIWEERHKHSVSIPRILKIIVQEFRDEFNKKEFYKNSVSNSERNCPIISKRILPELRTVFFFRIQKRILLKFRKQFSQITENHSPGFLEENRPDFRKKFSKISKRNSPRILEEILQELQKEFCNNSERSCREYYSIIPKEFKEEFP